MKNSFFSGFCTIIGPPNAGKSTLLNSLINFHLNIVSPLPQTTRNNILGILNKDDVQIIFTDTPGILKKKRSLLDQHMDSSIAKALESTDLVLFLIDIEDDLSQYRDFIDQLKTKKPVILVYNKIDTNPDFKPEVTEEPYILISAQKKHNIKNLMEMIKPFCKDPIEYYPQDILSNRTERFFVKEYIRESLLFHLKDEIPHECFVDVDEMKDEPEKWEIKVTIYCNKESQKKIIIGNNGAMIKNIGIQARTKIESLLDKKVNLKLFVKVEKKWRDNPHFLKRLEYY